MEDNRPDLKELSHIGKSHEGFQNWAMPVERSPLAVNT